MDNATSSNGEMNTRVMAEIAMLSALAFVIMFFEIPLWFAPYFYKMDFSELPVLIGGFALGPVAGILIELIKVLLHLLIKGTTTAGVGDLANFLVGCSMVVPASLIYQRFKTKKSAIIGMTVGTVVMALVGCLLNAYILLPFYSTAMGLPMETLVGMGTEVNPAIDNVFTFVVLAVAPFNLLKGLIVSILTTLIYKHVSPILKRA